MGELFDVGGLGQHLDKLTPEEKTIRIKAFYRILEGKRSDIDELAFRTELTSEQIRKIIKGLIQHGMLVIDEQGAIVGSHGLSLTPTEHHLYINRQNLFTWCAVDAIGIPAALGVDAKIISKCFQCNEPIEITMVNGEIQYSNKADSRIWVIEADLGRSIVGCA